MCGENPTRQLEAQEQKKAKIMYVSRQQKRPLKYQYFIVSNGIRSKIALDFTPNSPKLGSKIYNGSDTYEIIEVFESIKDKCEVLLRKLS